MAASKKKSARTTIKQLAIDDLARSGLTWQDAQALNIEVLTAEQVALLDPVFKKLCALKLNYHDANGKPTGHYRVRYLEKEISIAAFTKKGQPRYAQPSNSAPAIYFPKFVTWQAALGDAAVPLHLTEGEKKSAVGCKHGFYTLGLGGVWSWKSAKRGEALIPELQKIAWKDRPVFITYDSDAADKPDIVRAQLALADALTSLGARPYLITLPHGKDGSKMGLDDFIVQRGRDAYEELLEDASPYQAARELWALNAEVAYIKDPGLVVVLGDGRRLSPAAFTQHAYANRHYHETQLRTDGSTKLVKKPLAPAWLAWEQRAELEKLTYAPGLPPITIGREFNYWRGWGVEPKKGDVTLWKELLDHIFGEEKESRVWFERWCAYPLQHPGCKLYTASVIWGVEQGTGKSLIGYSLMRIYGKNAAEIGEQELKASFNEWAESKQFIMGDEITGSDHRREADRLKGFITQQQLRINMKHVPTYVVPDCINYYFTSNHPDAFFMEDTDRRMFIHEVLASKREDDFYNRYDKWYRSDEGAAALFHYLLHLDTGDFNPTHPAPLTRAKELMINDNKSDLARWVVQLRDAPDQVLKIGDAPINGDLFTNDELLRLYDPDGRGRVTANGLGRELRRAGLKYAHGGATIATSRGPQRLYIVRNRDVWEDGKKTTKDFSKHYDGRFEMAAAATKPKY